jgi:VIT1/CCC1 family predicted Fe2+/Mn2+ transporter
MSLLDSLKPQDSLTETVSGLIMMLSITLAAGVATDVGRDGAGTLILAAVGCNVAWGIIDATLYMMSSIFDRRRKVRLAHAIRAAPSEAAALVAIRRELDPYLQSVTRVEDREQLYRSISVVLAHGTLDPAGARREDLLGALAVFCLVIAATVPAVLPFLVISDPWHAMRVSNVLLVGLLFITGYHWAQYVEFNPWRAGLGLMSLGLALVAVAIVFGG